MLRNQFETEAPKFIHLRLYIYAEEESRMGWAYMHWFLHNTCLVMCTCGTTTEYSHFGVLAFCSLASDSVAVFFFYIINSKWYHWHLHNYSFLLHRTNSFVNFIYIHVSVYRSHFVTAVVSSLVFLTEVYKCHWDSIEHVTCWALLVWETV